MELDTWGHASHKTLHNNKGEQLHKGSHHEGGLRLVDIGKTGDVIGLPSSQRGAVLAVRAEEAQYWFETKKTTTTPPPRINCTWGEWDDWSACSASCGHGKKDRVRAIETKAANGGLGCKGSDRVSSTCIVTTCATAKSSIRADKSARTKITTTPSKGNEKTGANYTLIMVATMVGFILVGGCIVLPGHLMRNLDPAEKARMEALQHSREELAQEEEYIAEMYGEEPG